MTLKELFSKILRAKYTHLDNDASYCCKRDGDTLYIYFEWSNGITDWKNNFDFPAKPYRDMKDKWYCHRGFLRVWKTIEPHLKEHIMSADINTICIAGYSHGGAIAQLCYEYCKFNRPECNIFGYGFGAPRVLWGNVKKRVKGRFKGFVVIRNKHDIVTHLPPLVFGFRNVGTMLEIGTDASYNCIDAHRAGSYIKELETLEGRSVNAESCIVCGEIIPEGRQVCPKCEKLH